MSCFPLFRVQLFKQTIELALLLMIGHSWNEEQDLCSFVRNEIYRTVLFHRQKKVYEPATLSLVFKYFRCETNFSRKLFRGQQRKSYKRETGAILRSAVSCLLSNKKYL